jgi:hypothetical protein
MWIAGVREGVLYKVAKRPLDPRWSQSDLQTLLGLCATGQHLGWGEDRAFQAAEAFLIKKKLNVIYPDLWSSEFASIISGKKHEAEEN